MAEFRGTPAQGAKIDKTGFYILWPLAAFPLVVGPFTLITSPKTVFSDLGTTAVMMLVGLGWVLFWGLIPVFVYMSEAGRARKISGYRVVVDSVGIEFHTDRVIRMCWSEIESIQSDRDPESIDLIFKSRNSKFRYERWLEDDYGFVQQVRNYFPSAAIEN